MNPSRPVGRPPGPHHETLSKLVPAAQSIFLAEGGAALTPTRLHHETGVSRATIYRNWPEPADLIEVMLAKATDVADCGGFVGELRRDLGAAVDMLLHRFEHRPSRAFFAACVDYGRHSERVAHASEAFIAGMLHPIHVVIETAVESGQLDGDVDELVAEIAGPLVLEHVVLGCRVSRARAGRLIDRFLANSRPPCSEPTPPSCSPTPPSC